MRKRQLIISAALVLLASGAAAYVVAGMRLFTQYRTAYASYATSCDSLVTWNPPVLLYTAFYPNQPTLVTLRYRSPTPQQLRISLSIPQFTQVQSIQVDAGPAFQERAMKPPLLGNSALEALVGSGQRGAQIRLTIQSLTQRLTRTLCDTSVPVVLKSRQVIRWYDPVNGDNAKYLAGWVTPQDPTITTLVGRTASWLTDHPTDYGSVRGLVGYDEGRATPDEVRAQMDAVFDTLQFTYRLRYAEDNVPYAQNAEQIIQLPRDVLLDANPTGMCVETTAILAAVAERLGMRSYFVIVPGHIFLGIALGTAPSSPLGYWETSDLNGGVFGSQANLHGDSEYTSYNRQNEILRVIDVDAMRAQGIGPIE
ncbi:MAG: hypothetical protein IVW57_14150 [Ktedonobacterales bacterium]|nr:hypothetical protein [Ktedonobacterales bacterium]